MTLGSRGKYFYKDNLKEGPIHLEKPGFVEASLVLVDTLSLARLNTCIFQRRAE